MTWSKLDEAKHAAQVAMRTAADQAISRSRGIIGRAFQTASAAVMACGSEAELARLKNGFMQAVKNLGGTSNADDR